MPQRSVLLVSTYNFDRRPWNGAPFEFFNVLRQIEDAAAVAPEPTVRTLWPDGGLLRAMWQQRNSGWAMAREVNRLRRGRAFRASPVESDHDVCLYVCQYLKELPLIERVEGWRARSEFAAAFILETWSNEAIAHAKRLLDRFDHIFVFNAESVPALQRHTRRPVSFLPSGADCLMACPRPGSPDRVVDVLCLGRQIPEFHERMRAAAQRREWFYVFDVNTDLRAVDWQQIRQANAAIIMRSRYFIVWDPLDTTKAQEAYGDRTLTTRYFEGAAGGAVLIGTRTPGREFEALFDWPDVVVDVSPDGSDIDARLDELEGDPARCARIRERNIVNSLRRHDWCYRWQTILDAFGLSLTAAHQARLRELDERAALIETPSRGVTTRLEAPSAAGSSA